MSKYFRKDNEFVYLTDDYMEFYIPLDFFDQSKRFAVDFSSYIETLGLFYVGIFEKGSFKEFKVMKQPYTITVYVYDSENRTVQLPDGETVCKVLKYNKNAALMNSKIIQDAQSSLEYLDLVMGGKVPSSVPYNMVAIFCQKNKMVNKVNFGVRPEVEEMVIALNYRNPNDLSEPFAITYGGNLAVSPHAYTTVGTRQICQYASTFSSLTFEDMDAMLTTSINRSRKKGKEKFSPIEDVIKM